MHQLRAPKKVRFPEANHFMEHECRHVGWCPTLGDIMADFKEKFGIVFFAFFLTVAWTQMYPCVFGLSDVIEMEPLIKSNSDYLPSRVENTTVKSLDPSGELFHNPVTFVFGLLLFVLTMFHCPPTAGKAFSVIAVLATIICAVAQGISLYNGHSLQVLPVMSWLPTIYIRVNVAQIIILFGILGPRFFRGYQCPRVMNLDLDDVEWRKDFETETDLPFPTTASYGQRQRKTSKGKFYVCKPCKLSLLKQYPKPTSGASAPSNFASKNHSCYDMEKGEKDMGKTGIKTDLNDNEIGKNKGNTAVKAAIARLLIMFHVPPKDYKVKVQTFESKYGINHFAGFPDYPPVVKPDGRPNSFPSSPE
ncbi:unnamed protein product [Orchesella dallaii]|uniref:Uncharacterized protein n=1 Tax=Orchesella dallaii TaxID=48710 RepID=A0ABP1QAK3_9HEXA